MYLPETIIYSLDILFFSAITFNKYHQLPIWKHKLQVNALFNFQLMKEKIQLANSIIIIIIIHHNRSYNPHGAQACLFNINQIFHNLIHVCRVGNTFTPLLFSFRSTHLVVNLCYTNHHLFYSSSCRYTGVLQELVRSRYEDDYGKIRDVLGS